MKRAHLIIPGCLLVFAGAFIIRLFVGLSLPFDFESTSQWFAAKNIARGLGYGLNMHQPTALRMPGYSFILAVFIRFFGENTLPIIIFLAAIGAINATLCSMLGSRIFGKKAGLIAAALYALTPYLAQQESTTQVGLVATGLLAGTYFLFKALSEKRLFPMLVSTMFFLCAYLTRPTVGLIPAFISGALLFESWRRRSGWHLASAALFFSVFLLGLAPWAVRNNLAFGQFQVAQTNFWQNMYAVNHPQAFNIYPYAALDNLGPLFMRNDLPPEGNETVVEEWYRKKTMNEIAQVNFTVLMKRGFQKLAYLWHIRLVPFAERIGNDPETGRSLDRPRPLARNLAYSVPYCFLVIFALLGLWQERKRKALLLFFAGFLIAFSLPHMVTIAYSKYTLAVYFIIIIFAATAIARLLPGTKR